MRLSTYVLRRLLLSIPVILGVTILTFGIAWMANEGHMERAYVTEKMTPDQRERITDQYGFRDPWFLQYFHYLVRLANGDLGFSRVVNDQPVLKVMGEFFPATLELTLVAMVVAVSVGVSLGTLTAVRKDSAVDHATRFFALAGVSIPIFWLGLILKFAFATPYGAQLFKEGDVLLKALFLLIAVGLPMVLGLLAADALDLARVSRHRLLRHVAVSVVLCALLLGLGWTVWAMLVGLSAVVAFAVASLARLRKDVAFGRPYWQAAAVVLVVIAANVAVSPYASTVIDRTFELVPDLPLGSRFSNDLVAVEGAHPSLIGGPTRILLVDTALAGDWTAFEDVLSHLILPGITLGYASLAVIARMMRASMLDVLSADFIRTARAKGLAERVVIGGHARRNALIPIATVVGLTFGGLLSGAVLTETIFQWPGLGRWSTAAISRADTNSVMMFTLLVAIIYLVANLLVDIAYSVIDPRVRLE
ncbi:MAG: ABC transporter permease [Euryarchaeota archaeon]|nr:ABC transporter permease [Euryarchaeota archaeon]